MFDKAEDDEPKRIPAHESCTRHIFSEIYGTEYSPLKNFEEAKQYPDSYLIMEGDWGGQIYLSVPVKLVNCDKENLKTLLHDLDHIAWKCNEGDGAGIFYERIKSGEGIVGGMGGGIALDSLWVHDEFKNLEKTVLDILCGKKKSIKE